jgi:hypothetical protein
MLRARKKIRQNWLTDAFKWGRNKVFPKNVRACTEGGGVNYICLVCKDRLQINGFSRPGLNI